jgi:hypothetical protein
MYNVAFGYALLAGVSMATYIVGLRLASPDVHPALGKPSSPASHA